LCWFCARRPDPGQKIRPQPKAQHRASDEHRRRVAELRRLDHDPPAAVEQTELLEPKGKQ
jgi:hypothetical protein